MFRRKRSAEDFAEEIKAHLELEADALKAAGLGAEEAERKARREFGSVRAAHERFYLKGRLVWLDRFWQDTRFGWRSMWQSPGFTLTAILTLALGVGANTAVFSVMNAVLLRALPVEDPGQLVYLRATDAPRRSGTIDYHETFSYPVYDALRKQRSALSPLIAYVPLSTSKVAVRVGAQPEEAEGDMVSGTFFSGLGVKLVRGRGFSEQDETDHTAYAVISYNYWTRRFVRGQDALGQSLFVNGVAMTIVGISAEGFEGVEAGSSTDFWIPLQNRPELNAWGNPLDAGKGYQDNPTWWCLRLMGRLAPGVTRSRATAEMQAVFQTAAYVGLGNPEAGEKLPVLSLVEAKSFPGFDDEYGKPLKIMMAMVGLILLIALSNVAMLLIARNAARQREFSVRLALGAGRTALFRQLVTESLFLVTAGGLMAWMFARLATGTLADWAHIESSLEPDHIVLLFTLSILVLAAISFGLAPLRIALSTGPGLAVKTSAATSNSNSTKTRVGKIVLSLQIALCMVLLVGAGLLVRTLRNLENTPLGFPTDGLVVFGVKPHVKSIPDGVAFYRELTSKLGALPGVASVTVMAERIGSGWSNNNYMKVDGKLPDVSNAVSALVRTNVVGPNFFHTLGVPVLAGRDFADTDTATSPHVGIINEQFAKRFFPNQNPLGHLIGPKEVDYQMTIVGVVKDHKYRSIVEDPIPMAWYMYAQIPVIGSMDIELRAAGEPLRILPAAQKVLQGMDPDLPLIRPMKQRMQYDLAIARQLMFARLAEFFGVLAILLVATGLYGTVSYQVNRRTAEIGVRVAMGARPGQLIWMVLKDNLLLTVAGVALGAPVAMIIGQGLASSLYQVKPLDVLSYVCAVMGLTVVTLLASAIPARRAASIDPLRALRME